MEGTSSQITALIAELDVWRKEGRGGAQISALIESEVAGEGAQGGAEEPRKDVEGGRRHIEMRSLT